MKIEGKWQRVLVAVALALGSTACTGDDDDDDDGGGVPEVYEFESAFGDGSSVNYTGQIFRHVLIREMTGFVGGLTERIDGGTYTPAPGDVEADLMFYFDFDGTNAAAHTVPLTITADLPLMQATFGDVQNPGSKLSNKIAGADPGPQHVDWTVAGSLKGLSSVAGTSGAFTPTSAFMTWVAQLDRQAADWADGTIGVDPVNGDPLPEVFITPEGIDLDEMLGKFLGGAVAFSQASDDYLDDATPDAGILVPNTRAGDAMHTELEHHWDEGFGYFGAARDYRVLVSAGNTDAANDSNTDAEIDLLREYSYEAARYASRRDASSTTGTNFSGDMIDSFLAGRALINAAAHEGRELTTEELEELQGYRDTAIAAWESAIAASVIHYINETLAVQTLLADEDATWTFFDHAHVWTEMKALALGFQFNPRSALSDTQFETLHGHLGDAPVFESADLAAYETDLLAARTLLQTTYGFDTADVEAW